MQIGTVPINPLTIAKSNVSEKQSWMSRVGVCGGEWFDDVGLNHN